MPRRIVLVSFGSWGDVVPYVALAMELAERGHHVVLATSVCYREKVEGLGVRVTAVRPNSDWVVDPGLMRWRSHRALGLIRVAREWVLPALRETYDDLGIAVEGADVLVSHPLAAWAARLVAEKKQLAWVSTMLVPLGFFSAYDGTVFPLPAALATPLRWLGPRGRRVILNAGARATRFLATPWYQLRREIGLPPAKDRNPLGDSHSPQLNLALFSKVLAREQPDWPARTVITGFPICARAIGRRLPAELERFLESGPPPIVFTLGNAVSSDAGEFFETSVAAARALGCRAVCVGPGAEQRGDAGADAIGVGYAPFTGLFAKAAAVVHHGGIGTTALAMRAGRPMLVLPRAWDQPDNAARVARLGIARVLEWRRCTATRLARELRRLLGDSYGQRALAVREQVREEDGVRAACEAIETLFQHSAV